MTGFSKATVAVIVERDRGACVRCGRPVELSARGIAWSIHHRRPRGMGGSRNPAVSAPENGLVLCGSGTTGCHGAVEANRDAARRRGFLVPQWRNPAAVPVLHRAHGWSWPCSAEWVPLTVPERRLQAAEWLNDNAPASGALREELLAETTALYRITEEEAA